MEPIIKVEHLSKKYKLGEWQKYYTLRDTLAGILKVPFKLFTRKKPGLSKGEFWALNDVSFEVGRSETVGIIGPNGAGKSTLLKILSRITPPSKGSAILRGRVGSLLEVGTGFHQELTGRENIYLNGAILGMNRREINKKFNEIVDFSGMEKFLDTPVKHYSTGMYMRLAFAVAAHLDTEILIVDEVLAVGDAEFQEKCLRKMDSLSKENKRTIIFVSHNMEAVQKLCNRAILINHGKIIKDGDVTSVVEAYLKQTQEVAETSLYRRKDREGTGQIKVTKIGFGDGKGNAVHNLVCGEDGEIEVDFKCYDKTVKNFDIAVDIKSFYDQIRIAHVDSKILRKKISINNNPIRIRFQKIPLLPDRYELSISITGNEGDIYDMLLPAQIFSVNYGDFYKTGSLPSKEQGPLLIHYDIQ